MLRIEMLPAAHGDAIWIEYGTTSKLRRILIDAGPINTYDSVYKSIKAATTRHQDVELFVITHIDTDHIDGAVLLLRDHALKVNFGDIWFNAWQQLAVESVPDSFGPEQGEFVSALINLKNRPWNRAFEGRAAVVPDSGPLPVVSLAGGATITLLSPGDRQLRRLRRNWASVIVDAGWKPGDAGASLARLEERREYEPTLRRDSFAADTLGTDNAVANGSSIAFLFEYEGNCCLFTGDAFPDVLASGLARYATEKSIKGRVPLDVVKVPHHGSAKNWSPELHQGLTAKHFLISTNGARFKHPDHETLDAILTMEPEANVDLWFNYLSPTTEPWKNASGKRNPRFTSHYPEPGKSMVITLP